MEHNENKTFEKIYPPVGCLFVLLAIPMGGLTLLSIMGLISLLSQDKLDWYSILLCVSLIIVLGSLFYFCVSRCFSRIPIGIYPTHLTINNKKYPWSDVENITFDKSQNSKSYGIEIKLNKKKYTRFNIVILSIAVIVTIVLVIEISKMPDTSGNGEVAGLLFIFPAMFGVGLFKPKSRLGAIEFEDFDNVFNLTKYYASLYHIPVEDKRK